MVRYTNMIVYNIRQLRELEDFKDQEIKIEKNSGNIFVSFL